MGLLTPLYLAGLLTISLPLVLHLIRRTPRGRVPFGSLMFLSPSPPRVTRRSRLDNLALLILRGTALFLLAVAFARPFLRKAELLSGRQTPGRRIAVLVDTSASMRRPGLWHQAVNRVQAVVERASRRDRVAILAFDRRLRTVVGFEDWSRVEPGGRAALVKQRMAGVVPGWDETDLGAALVAACQRLQEAREDATAFDAAALKQVVLVSDVQQGSQLDALESFEWPEDVLLSIEPVIPRAAGNTAVRVLADGAEQGEAMPGERPRLRVRVINAGDSTSEQFQLHWAAGDGSPLEATEVSAYVPAGESRVVRVPLPPPGAKALVLAGDDADFDNTFYYAPLQPREVTVAYVGEDSADDPQGLLYYLQRALPETPWLAPELSVYRPDEPAPDLAALRPELTVAAGALAEDHVDALRRYLDAGGSALLVLKGETDAETAARLMSVESLAAEEAQLADYAMLADVQTQHAMFASFTEPQFADFTKIHFWRHRRLHFEPRPGLEVLARFDNGAVAVCQQAVGSGRLLVLASGWHPDDSQLARSSKFVPLLGGLISPGGPPTQRQLQVGERLLGDGEAAARAVRADGSTVASATSDAPGIYTLVQADQQRQVAVNLAPEESRTEPLPREELEQRGLPLGEQPDEAEQVRLQRQKRDLELEREQSIWKWLVVGVLGLLLAETTLAGRLARRIGNR